MKDALRLFVKEFVEKFEKLKVVKFCSIMNKKHEIKEKNTVEIEKEEK